MNYFDIEFYIRPRPVNKELISALVEAVTDLGSIYNENMGYWSAMDDRGPFEGRSLEEAIDVVSRDQGSIPFFYKNIGYNLDIRPMPISTKLGSIMIYIDHVYLDPSYTEDRLGEKGALDECLMNAEQLVEIAKAVWNVLEPKPIYGLGDYDIYDWMTIPTDEEILNLKVEPHIFILNFYGPELIEKFGKRKLLSMPAYRVEELDDGVMFLKSHLPVEHGYGIGRGISKGICEHMGWKTYFVNIFNIDMFKPRVSEYGIREKKFRNISALKRYLKRDMDKFRKRVESGRVFVILEKPSGKPVPHHVREMGRWVRDEMRAEVTDIAW
ncbi:MAG: hypothetical protein C4B59_15610 [Candidatus Methanogaster sp.]|uniref:Uncharacterized protein n=1 Tax=Candidatus Methanogaster sp. TaxID=3386292 RepID=A0AC61KYV0_9EURY|nr:MAG: hypothetical protein C4B59_15610 [ANME-2 cluster archaeon]